MFLSYNFEWFDMVDSVVDSVVAAVSGCRNIMVMFPFVRSYNSFRVCWRPLNMLSDIAPSTSAFVVAPVDRNVSEEVSILVAISFGLCVQWFNTDDFTS